MFPPGGKFTERARIIIGYANEEARRLNHSQIDTEHLLLGLIHEGQGIAARALQDLGVDLERLEMEVMRMIKKPHMLTESIRQPPSFTRAADQVLRFSMEEAQRLEYDHVGTEHILLGLIREKNGIAARVLTGFGVTLEKIRKVFKPISNPTQRKAPRSIDQFSRDLTQLARENMIDPIIGREDEMERVMQILIRRKKNNPVLIGEPGVGKTAIAEGLALKIVNEEVPEPLLDKQLVTLDLAGLVAGTKYRGQFEERLKNIMNEIRQSQDIILFIDELHTLVGTGAAEGAIDAANILKPSLSRGEIQCIGATTLDEYRKYIEKDGALERRFQIVNVPQPTVEETIEILKGLKNKYEEHHNVIYTQEAIEAAAKFSARYISDRYLPDKAIDVIDEAGSRIRMRSIKKSKEEQEQNGWMKSERDSIEAPRETLNIQGAPRNSLEFPNLPPILSRQLSDDFDSPHDESLTAVSHPPQEPVTLTEEDISAVIAKWTGIPISKLEETESEKLLRMEDVLQEVVVGQNDAITALVRAVRRSRAGLKDPTKPIGSFIFIGPTGVGKSYLAHVLAEYLFGRQDAIIRIDMSEFMEKFAVSRLIGAPPGYVGYQEGGELTEKVRRRPYSVILLDEIEKAHPDVFNILLQVLDNGRLTDNLGHTVDFRNTILIMTSNAGGRDIAKGAALGFGGSEADTSNEAIRSKVMSELKRVFNPEFLNRIDEVIVFNPLTREHIGKITELMLDEVKKHLKENNVELVFMPDALEFIIEKGYDPHFGARHLRRIIQRHVEDSVARKLLDGSAVGNVIYVLRDGDHLVFTKEEPVSCQI
jgi:ATP-dependent Clp protease ATP-binding subunit ClpC